MNLENHASVIEKVIQGQRQLKSAHTDIQLCLISSFYRRGDPIT